MKKVDEYVRLWEGRGYENGIPDIVPEELMRMGLAPSYKAIAIAILENDLNFYSLGFTKPGSEYYNALKRIELLDRQKDNNPQEIPA